jgi:hypothetical protein
MHTTRSRLAAGLVVAAAALSLPVAAHASQPPIAPAPMPHVKYILPPRSAGDYWAVRTAAEAAGYDVVENDGRPVRD